MAEKGNYRESEKSVRRGGKSKVELLMQMYANRGDVPTDVRDPSTRTEELYPLRQRAP